MTMKPTWVRGEKQRKRNPFPLFFPISPQIAQSFRVERSGMRNLFHLPDQFVIPPTFNFQLPPFNFFIIFAKIFIMDIMVDIKEPRNKVSGIKTERKIPRDASGIPIGRAWEDVLEDMYNDLSKHYGVDLRTL